MSDVKATMTETEWLNGSELAPMLQYLHGVGSNRKLRLFACSCFRSIWDQLKEGDARRLIDLAEDLVDCADNASITSMFFGAWNGVARMFRASLSDGLYSHLRHLISPHLTMALVTYLTQQARIASDRPGEEAGRMHLTLLRDILGNPFRPAKVDRRWLTWNEETATRIATAVYAERAFDRLPILADALEDAGCDNADLLDHLRGPGPHVRGCWALDLILGKG
jgi:hypothetical protein